MAFKVPIPRPGYWPPDTLCLADAVEFVGFAAKVSDPRLKLRQALASEKLIAELSCDGGVRHPIVAAYWAGPESDKAFVMQYPFVPVLVEERYGRARRQRRRVERREFGAIVLKKAEVGATFGADVDAWQQTPPPAEVDSRVAIPHQDPRKAPRTPYMRHLPTWIDESRDRLWFKNNLADLWGKYKSWLEGRDADAHQRCRSMRRSTPFEEAVKAARSGR
jgi:hypothetical protein